MKYNNPILAYLKTRGQNATTLLNLIEDLIDTDFGKFLKRYVAFEQEKVKRKVSRNRKLRKLSQKATMGDKKAPLELIKEMGKPLMKKDEYLEMIMGK